MTETELAQTKALAACKFSPGSTAKRFVAWAVGKAAAEPDFKMSSKATAFLDELAHQYRKQVGKCLSVSCVKCNPAPIDLEMVRIAVDAVTEGRTEFDAHLPSWLKAALALYNKTNGTKHAHPYEYATRVAPTNRRAKTLGNVFCRYCGECLFQQVKQPHLLVKASPPVERHLAICGLQLLAGMRTPARPGHRALPMEDLWR